MNDEGTIRSFLAIGPPDEVLREIASVQDGLRKLLKGDIRWVRPEGIHLTLWFFAEITRDEAAAIGAVVGKAAGGERPFSLSVGGVGVFPDPRRPRVLWLGMDGDVDRLVAFRKRIGQSLQQLGFPREERPFRPHLTLGRIRSARGLMGVDRVLAGGGRYEAGRFVAPGLALIRSSLTPGGALYTPMGWFPFSGNAADP